MTPEKSATLYKVGTIRIGNDGNKWIVTENKNGIKKWSKHKNLDNLCKTKSVKTKFDDILNVHINTFDIPHVICVLCSIFCEKLN